MANHNPDLEAAHDIIRDANVYLAQIEPETLSLGDRLLLTRTNNELVKVVNRIKEMTPYML